MLIKIYPFLALGGAIATPLLLDFSLWWGLLLFPAYYLGLIAAFFLLGILLSPLFSKKKIPEKPNPICRFMLTEAYSMALSFMQVRCRVRGMEHLPKRGTTFLVVCNHLSNYDHMLMVAKLHRFPISFLSKPENFRIPIVGRYLWNSGFLSIDRQSARNALTTVNETARRIRSGGMCYGVFPEGTRSRTGQLLKFHDGVFLSARKADSGILVIHVSNTQMVNKRGPWRPTRVRMDVLSYLTPDFVAEHSDQEISTHVRDMMLSQFPNAPEVN